MVTEHSFTISEQFIVGAILKQPKAALTILASQHLDENSFEQPVTHICMRAISQLVQTNQPVEPASVLKQIFTIDPKTSVTIDTLRHCEKMCSSSSYLLQHVAALKDRKDRNELEDIIRIGREKLDAGIETKQVIDEMKWLVTGLTTHPKQTSAQVIEDILHLYQTSMTQGFTGMPSRWLQIQQISGGYPRKGVTVLSGLTKHGKTTMACNEILHMCRQNIRVLFISLEMSEGQIRALFAGDTLDLDLVKLRNGEFPDDEQQQEFERFKECLIEQKNLTVTIIDGSKGIEEIDSLIRGAQNEFDVVVIDHLHLVRKGPRDPSSREERVSIYSNTITNATVDANVATILIAQLSRDGLVDKDGNPLEPHARHLKGSGSIEQDLTQLIFIYQKPSCGKHLIPDKAPTIINVAMNRIGRVGREEFVFVKSKQKLIPRVVWEMHEGTVEENDERPPF